jgi:hypothetical protein
MCDRLLEDVFAWMLTVEAVIHLISSTTTAKGLKIVCVKDDRHYELGTVVTDEEFAAINMEREKTLGYWNYCAPVRVYVKTRL